MPSVAPRLLLALAFLAGAASLPAQVRVTTLTAATDLAACYRKTSWGSLHGVKRVTTPLLNLTFVTDSGFYLAQRDASDRSLPASLRLQGLDAADFQEIADAVHDTLVAALQAQGIEVMPYDPLAVNPGFQELARQAGRTGREQPVPADYQTIAGVSGARRTMTFVGHHCPWVESFMLDNYLPAARLTRELEATLPILSFLVEFIEYSPDRTITYDWRDFLPAAPGPGIPRLRARPQVFVSAGTASFLTPDGQSGALTLTVPLGYEHAFATNLAATRGRNREERSGGSYEVLVNPAAYKQAAIAVLNAQATLIARQLATATP